jgi:hypothetical protein
MHVQRNLERSPHLDFDDPEMTGSALPPRKGRR